LSTVASQILDITLTARDGGQAGKVPMCGVPYHAADNYVAKLIAAGHTVAICEQTEDPSTAKGLVRREVVRTITPGTHAYSPPDTLNYIVALGTEDESFTLAAVEYNTGATHIMSGKGALEALAHELTRLMPREAIFPTRELPGSVEQALKHAGTIRHRLTGLTVVQAEALCGMLPECSSLSPLERVTLAEILNYLRQVGICSFAHFTAPQLHQETPVMPLDSITRRNLELTRTMRQGERTGSLLWVLDHTITSMGTRLIRQWVEQPLTDLAHIERRQSAVEELHASVTVRGELRAALASVGDLERLLTRAGASGASPRDLLAIAKSLASVADVRVTFDSARSPMLERIRSALDPHPHLTQMLFDGLCDEPPVSAREGGLIRDGHNAEIDDLRQISRTGKNFLAELESRERQITGIKSMKVGYNRVFGYYLEVTKPNLADVPAHYHRKQTLVNAERFVTDELKQFETAVLTAQERVAALEYEVFAALCARVVEFAPTIVRVARHLAELDVLQSFAEAAARYRYVRPQIVGRSSITIVGGRHPVVERIVGAHAFVPNDTELGHGEIAILTGPNMAGKSTYMRQVALIILMAQIGSFVPATRAMLGLIDRIFTRVGAADDIFSGQSTFMVEMSETALALREATAHSLLLFDEVGRGTSTYDGMALARAIMEHVHDSVRARTLFSTHYHELTNLTDTLERCRNYTVAVMEQNKDVVFLRRVLPGKANKSYGIHVAELAGLPRSVTQKAYALLKDLEQTRRFSREQTTIFDYVAEAAATYPTDPDALLGLTLLREIQQLDPAAVTPLQALTLLHELKRRISETEV